MSLFVIDVNIEFVGELNEYMESQMMFAIDVNIHLYKHIALIKNS